MKISKVIRSAKLTLLRELIPNFSHKNDPEYSRFSRKLRRVQTHIEKYMNSGSAVIYCATKKQVDEVSNYLAERFPGQVVKCHAFMELNKRIENELNFITGKRCIMVATTAFGMGVDKPNIRLVIHFNLPLSVIDYYQQIGRAGRDGNKAHAIMLYHPDDIVINKYLIDKIQDKKIRKWANIRLQDMITVAETGHCLMRQMLTLLGEVKKSSCNHCTNCQKRGK